MEGKRIGFLHVLRVVRRAILVVLTVGLVLSTLFLSGCGKKSASTTGSQPSSATGTKPGEEFIVFERDYKLVRADRDGTGQETITAGFDTDPAISADGTRTAYAHSGTDPRTNTSLTSTPPPVVSIYTAGADGSDPVRVTPQAWGTSSGWDPLFTRQEGTVWMQRDCGQPSFSRDGSRLAFVMRDHAYQETADGGRGSYGLEAVAVIGLTGSQKGKLDILVKTEEMFGGAGYANPRFSGNGAYVYFQEFPGSGPPASSITRVDTDGGNKKVIANYDIDPGQGGSQKGWYAFDISSADGRIAAIELSMGGAGGGATGKIVMMDPDGSNQRDVNTGSAYVGSDNLCFSPDGRSLAFSTQEFGRQTQGAPSDIDTVKTDGTGLNTIVTNGRAAAWGKAEAND